MKKLAIYLIIVFVNGTLGAQEEASSPEYTIPPEFQSEVFESVKEPFPRYLGMGILGVGSAGALLYSYTNFYNFYEGVKDASLKRGSHESLYSGVLGIVVSASLSLLLRELFLDPQPPQKFLTE